MKPDGWVYDRHLKDYRKGKLYSISVYREQGFEDENAYSPVCLISPEKAEWIKEMKGVLKAIHNAVPGRGEMFTDTARRRAEEMLNKLNSIEAKEG